MVRVRIFCVIVGPCVSAALRQQNGKRPAARGGWVWNPDPAWNVGVPTHRMKKQTLLERNSTDKMLDDRPVDLWTCEPVGSWTRGPPPYSTSPGSNVLHLTPVI